MTLVWNAEHGWSVAASDGDPNARFGPVGKKKDKRSVWVFTEKYQRRQEGLCIVPDPVAVAVPRKE